MSTWEAYKSRGIPGRLEAARIGQNPTVIGQMKSGFAVLCDAQVSLGWCILLADPPVESLGAIPLDEQTVFLRDMAILGDALQSVTGCARVNYAIYGNADPFLHAHLIPRYANEPAEQLRRPIWEFVRPKWSLPEYQFDPEKHGSLQDKLRLELHHRNAIVE
jgi:diadenosine tetraphosphate (Ap4A) HIT family hydrolase